MTENGERKKNVLVVAAHPDDCEISCMGYVIDLLERGHEVTAAVMAVVDPDRRLELNMSFNALCRDYDNFSFVTRDFADGKLHDSESRIKNFVETTIDRNSIDLVITHFPKDTHRDHRTVAQACIDAARKVSLIFFESPNVYEFEPNYYVPLSERVLERKIEQMSYHASQNVKNDNFYIDKIRANAAFRGQAVYEKYAEAFHVHRWKR